MKMLLSPQEAELFFKLYRSLMSFVNKRLQVAPDYDSPDQYGALSPETRLKLRNAFLGQAGLIELFVDANPFDLTADELGIVASWRLRVAGRFFIFRYLKNHAVFLATEKPPTAYGVVALTDPFENLVGPYLPIWTETMLLPFRDKIVYDGLLNSYNISFGAGFRRNLNEDYKAAKERLGIVTSLPIEARPVAEKKPPKKARPKPARASSDEFREIQELIAGMVDQFCREHLNEEYAVLCRKLTEKLARKRPSPLLSGKPNTWACGIVRTIGWMNFLDDRSQKPHMKLTAIDKLFGVGESTGQGKSMLIRRMFKIRQFDHHWMLPSRIEDSPTLWMLNVNGFFMDIRDCPREAQEIAFEKGLIPYIPADQD
jgi:hypothetical protein